MEAMVGRWEWGGERRSTQARRKRSSAKRSTASSDEPTELGGATLRMSENKCGVKGLMEDVRSGSVPNQVFNGRPSLSLGSLENVVEPAPSQSWNLCSKSTPSD